MFLLLLAWLVITPPTIAEGQNRCDSLYAALQSARERVDSGLGRARTTDAAQQEWRQTVRHFLTLAQKTRQCYEPVSPPTEASPSDPEEAALPTPASLQRERVMKTYGWVALAYRELRQYDDAFAQFDAYFERFGTSTDSSHVAYMYNARGYLHYLLGNLSASIDDYTKTIAYTPAADTLQRIELLTDLGIILQRVRDKKSARQHYAHAEKLARQLPSSPRVRELLARAIHNQGDILLRNATDRDSLHAAADRRWAIRRLQKALELYPSDALERRARIHIVLGEAYALVGDSEAAFRYLQQGHRLAERLNNPDVLALAELKLGRTHLMAGALDAAEAPLHRAVRFAQTGHHNEYHRQALHYLGKLHEMQEKWPAAEDAYRQAISVTEKLRASLRATDWAAVAFNEWIEPYRGLVRVLAAQKQHAASFHALEQTRARHLRDLQLQSRLTSTLAPRDRVRFDSLTAALMEVRSRLAETSATTDRHAELTSREVRLMAQRRTLLDLDAPLTVPSLQRVQRQLKQHNRTLVSYSIDAPDSFFGRSVRSFATVVTPDTLHFAPLSVTRDDIDATLADVSPLLTSTAEAPTLNSANFNLDALHRLYEQTYAPLAQLIPDSTALTVLPDGPLFRIPFGALVTQTPGPFAYQDAQYLTEKRPVAAEIAAALFTDTTQSRRDFAYDLAGFGRTRFETIPSLPISLRRRTDSTALPPLLGVAREMEATADQFARSRILLDDQATETRFYDLQDQAKVLHLASHAFVNASNPLNNLFLLSPEEGRGSRHDGLLYMHELECHRNTVPLVVLSACSTARGLHRSGEGPQGLQYAFRAMGAESTLSTLWPSDDNAAVALTKSFYHFLQQGLPKDVALQRAQLDYLETHDRRLSPFYWAAPVLYGSTRPLDLAKPDAFPVLPLAAGGLVLLGLGLAYARYRRTRSNHG